MRGCSLLHGRRPPVPPGRVIVVVFGRHLSIDRTPVVRCGAEWGTPARCTVAKAHSDSYGKPSQQKVPGGNRE